MARTNSKGATITTNPLVLGGERKMESYEAISPVVAWKSCDNVLKVE